jgi:hypothetical protein
VDYEEKILFICHSAGRTATREFLTNYIEGLEAHIEKNEERDKNDIGYIRNSLSWKMTAPLRLFGKMFVK